MESMYTVFYNIWSSAFGATYTADHPDLLALLSTFTVIMCVYGLLRLFCHFGKKVLPK